MRSFDKPEGLRFQGDSIHTSSDPRPHLTGAFGDWPVRHLPYSGQTTIGMFDRRSGAAHLFEDVKKLTRDYPITFRNSGFSFDPFFEKSSERYETIKTCNDSKPLYEPAKPYKPPMLTYEPAKLYETPKPTYVPPYGPSKPTYEPVKLYEPPKPTYEPVKLHEPYKPAFEPVKLYETPMWTTNNSRLENRINKFAPKDTFRVPPQNSYYIPDGLKPSVAQARFAEDVARNSNMLMTDNSRLENRINEFFPEGTPYMLPQNSCYIPDGLKPSVAQARFAEEVARSSHK